MKKLASTILLLLCTVCAAETSPNHSLEREAALFFDDYINTFNTRIGHPERSEAFRSDMAELLYEPLLSAPQKSAPRVMTSRAEYAKNLESFIGFLESKGVVSLQYDSVQLHVLTPTKVLANNIGRGIDAAGETQYETISVYLLYLNEGQWQIAMLSAYDMDKAMDW